jgi:hypothetical protein
LIKVALHPGDLEGPDTEAVLERVFAAGSAVAYGELFGPGEGRDPSGGALGNRNATSGARG